MRFLDRSQKTPALCTAAVLALALAHGACGRVAGAASDKWKGSGDLSGFGRDSRPTPSERVNNMTRDADDIPVLSRQQQDALQRTDVVSAIAELAARGCQAERCGTEGAMLRRAAEEQLAAIADVQHAAAYLPVEAAGRSTTEFQAVRARLVRNAMNGEGRALHDELMAADQQLSADMEALSSTSHEGLRAAAARALTTTRAALETLQGPPSR